MRAQMRSDALASLVAAGLLIEEEAPTNRTPGKYRAVATPAPALKPAPCSTPRTPEGERR